MSPVRTTQTATILVGESISSAIDLSLGSAVFVHMPLAWTPAVLSFLISADGVTYGDFVDKDTREVSINVIPGTVFRTDILPPVPGWLKFRSGSRDGAVAQEADRDIVVTIDT